MQSNVSVQRIVLVPRNGLANRLQAWASSFVLSTAWGVPLYVAWETERVMPSSATQIFGGDVLSRWACPKGFTHAEIVAEISHIPRYLNRIDDTLVLAGHDRGEQYFMADVQRHVLAPDGPATLLIVAGGKFHLPDVNNFDLARSDFYNQLTWSKAVEDRFSQLRVSNGYSALHVRGTDRSLDAPTSKAIKRALRALRRATEHDRLFICADSSAGRRKWARMAESLGFQTFAAQTPELDRESPQSVIDAAVDWRMLTHAKALVFPAASTFSNEALVASRNACTPYRLSPSPSVRRIRVLRNIMVSGFTYPRRNWL